MQSNYFWMGDYIYPEGSHPHALYGRNSNQGLIQYIHMPYMDVTAIKG